MEEEDHFTQTQLSLLSYTAAYGSPSCSLLVFSHPLLSLLCSLTAYLQARMVPPALALLQQWWLPTFDILDGCTWLVQLQLQALDNGNPLLEQGCCHISGNIPTRHPLAFLVQHPDSSFHFLICINHIPQVEMYSPKKIIKGHRHTSIIKITVMRMSNIEDPYNMGQQSRKNKQ